MGEWIRTRGISGEYGYQNMRTGEFRTTMPTESTVSRTTTNSTGISQGKRRALDAATKQTNSYNTRAHKVHNYADETRRLAQKHQNVHVQSDGTPTIVQSDYTPGPEAPMEQVSPEFDLLNMWRLGMTSVAKEMKPLVSTNANTGVKTVTEIPALSDADILKAFNEAKQYHLNRINSPEWEQAAIRSKQFSPEEIPVLRNELTTQLNRVKFGSIADEVQNRWGVRLLNSNTSSAGDLAVHQAVLRPGGTTMDDVIHTVSLVNKNMSYDSAVDNFIHELGHGMTSGLGSTAENLAANNARLNLESKLFPQTQKLIDYNNSLLPTRTADQILNSGVKATEKGMNWIRGYLGEATEKTARGYVGKKHIADLTNYAKANNLNSDYNSITQWLGSRVPNMQQLNWVGGAENTPNFYKNVLGITAPIGAFGYAASSTNSTSSQYHKQGGQIKYFYD